MKVTAIGEILFDVSGDTRTPGGAPANFSFHVHKLGVDSALVTAVGDDADGRQLLDFCRFAGFSVYPRISSFPTGVSEVKFTGGEISYEIRENSAWDDLDLTDEASERIINSDVLAYGSLIARSRAGRLALEKALSLASKKLCFCDLNLRQHYYSEELIEFLLKSSGVIKLNLEEFATVLSISDPGYTPVVLNSFEDLNRTRGEIDRLLTKLVQQYDLRGILLTAGVLGSAVLFDGVFSVLPASESSSGGDSVGAGDAFSAAFICSVLRGESVPQCHACAADYAACVCSCKGAWSPDIKCHDSDI